MKLDGDRMIEQAPRRIEIAEAGPKEQYVCPVFSVVALSVITLGGSPGTTDSKTGIPGTAAAGDLQGGEDSVEAYDDDPLGDPWEGSRGG